MTKVFVLLAILLIATGTLLLAVPKSSVEPAGRSLAPQAVPPTALVTQLRDLAEQVNAPLSIFFGLVSLYYSRRTYVINRDREAQRASGTNA